MDDRFQPCQSASGILKGVETTSHLHLLGGKKLMFLQHHNTKPHTSFATSAAKKNTGF